MISRVMLILLVGFFTTLASFAQNFSGLQNKKLSKVEDLGASLESLLSRLGGRIEGNIDSVVVISDTEKELRVRIFYTGFVNGYFRVSTMNNARQSEQAVNACNFSQTAAASPAECILSLNAGAPGSPLPESPYLRIDIAKKEGVAGKVRIFDLRKKWLPSGGVSAPGMLIRVMLEPVGVAATLNPVSDNGVVPSKKLRFNKAVLDNMDGHMKVTPVKSSGGYSVPVSYRISDMSLFDDISGTWLNANKSAPLTKLIVSGNNYIRLFSRPSAQAAEYESAKGAMSTVNATQYFADLKADSKLDGVKTNIRIDLNLVSNQLAVKYATRNGMFTPTRTYNYTFQREVTNTKAKLAGFSMNEYKLRVPDKKPPPTQSTVAEGAGTDVIYLWDEISVDNLVDFKNPQDISNINMTVIPDKNPFSGIYYYMPADFHLIWNPAVKAKRGYGMSISYGKQTGEPEEETTDGSVRMSAILTAGISPREKDFVRDLLKSINPNFKEVRTLPLRENLETSFPGTLTALYNIPAERISVISGTDFSTGTITVAWRTDAATKEEIQTALTSGEGIAASVILKPKNEQIPSFVLDAGISLSNQRSFGKMELEPATWRTKEWTNQTSFPLKLKYLHVLRKSPAQTSPVIYSWSLNNLEVAPQGRVSFDNSRVPVWLDNDPTSVMWLDYNVVDCNSCKDSVIFAVIDGVPAGMTQQIKINIPPAVYDTLKSVSFIVTVRSLQADPRGATMIELPAVKVTREAGKVFMVGPLFIQKGGSPDFEFNIKAETADGDFYLSDQWIRSSEREILLGKTRMKEIFKGIIPGLE